MLKTAVYLTAALLCIAVHSKKVTLESGLENKDVQRKIDLTSCLVRISSDVTLQNSGKQPVSTAIFAAEFVQGASIASIKAYGNVKDEDDELVLEEVTADSAPDGTMLFQVILKNPLSVAATVTLRFKTVYSHGLTPFPAEVKQAERQLVKFTGELYYLSPYKTASQKTVVSLASANVESYTKTKPVSKSESTITYGPYDNKDAFAVSSLSVHYENNTPFLAVTSMKRIIEVSHWGNIAVEETLDVRHTGAKLKGPFSRYDYQRQPNPYGSIKAYKTVLPASAVDVYYRDEIGNISTSNMKVMDDAVEVELKPRFVLFGGWKTHYVLGYNLPSYQYLWTDGGAQYALDMPFIDHVFDNQVIDEVEVRIILPEGSDISKVSVPFKHERGDDETLYTYLDTVGRPVIVLRHNNLVDEHIKHFNLRYSFNKMLLLREPLLVCAFLFSIFFLIIVYVRLDFAISRDEATEKKMKVDSYVEAVRSVLDKRAALYQEYDGAVTTYKDEKEMAAYVSTKKKLDDKHDKLGAELQHLQADIKAEGAHATAEKLAEIQKLDKAYMECAAESLTKAERIVSGKMKKEEYINEEDKLKARRAEILEKINHQSDRL